MCALIDFDSTVVDGRFSRWRISLTGNRLWHCSHSMSPVWILCCTKQYEWLYRSISVWQPQTRYNSASTFCWHLFRHKQILQWNIIFLHKENFLLSPEKKIIEKCSNWNTKYKYSIQIKSSNYIKCSQVIKSSIQFSNLKKPILKLILIFLEQIYFLSKAIFN